MVQNSALRLFQGLLLLTLLTQFGCAKDPTFYVTPLTADQAFLWGLKEPFMTLKYLGFITLTAPFALTVSHRRWDPLWFCLLAFVSFFPAYYAGPLPGVALGVALTLVFALILQWTGTRYLRWSTPLMLVAGCLHGYDLGSSLPRSSLSVHGVYALSFSLMMGVLAYGIGLFCQRLLAKSSDDYDSYENLVSAIVSGITLVYLVWAIKV